MRHDTNNGFTLIELIVVIVLVGILSAVAVPKFIDLGQEARATKMQAQLASARTAYSTAIGKWRVTGGTSITLSDGSTVPFVDMKSSPMTPCGTNPQSCGCVPSAQGMVTLLQFSGGTYPSRTRYSGPGNFSIATKDSWAYGYSTNPNGTQYAYFGLNTGDIVVPSDPKDMDGEMTCGFTYAPPTSCSSNADPFYSNFGSC